MKQTSHKILPIILLAGILLPVQLLAQRIEAKVTFYTDKLSQDEKEFIRELDQKVKNAVETFNWEGAKKRYVLPISYDIFWEQSTRVGTFHNYSAGIMVSPENGIAFRDKRMEFRYSQDEWLHLGSPYEPFAGILEFYTWICLGIDADKWSPLGGNVFYDRAHAVGEQARSEAQFSLGWDDRRSMALEISDSLYSYARRARFHQNAGLYYLKAGNAQQASANLSRAIQLLEASPWKHSILKLEDHVIKYIDEDQIMNALKELEMSDEVARFEEWIKNRRVEEGLEDY